MKNTANVNENAAEMPKCSHAARESISNIYTWTGSQSIARSAELVKAVRNLDVCRDVTQPAKIRFRQIRILCFKSVGCRCIFFHAITACSVKQSYNYTERHPTQRQFSR